MKMKELKYWKIAFWLNMHNYDCIIMDNYKDGC